jgi:hypothetical protein
MDLGQVNMRVTEELKITDALVTIQNLEKERTYTPGNDPERKFLREQDGGAAQALADQAEQLSAMVARNGSSSTNSIITGFSGSPVGDGGSGRYKIMSGTTPATIAAEQAGSATALAGSTLTDPSFQAGRMEDALSKELFDAMRVSFVASSPTLIRNPYIVVIVQYRGPEEKSGEAHDWIYASELAPIDSQSRKVSIMGGGLTPGFTLLNCQVHLYDRGRELATTESPRRLPLTRKEAFEYVLVSYLSAHKGGNLPAAAAMGRLSPEQRARLANDQFGQPYFVKVTKDGLPAGAYSDQACTQRITDPALTALIDQVRFTPALNQGNAVEGVAKLNFNQLSL